MHEDNIFVVENCNFDVACQFAFVSIVDDCEQCDIHAICVQGACKCRVGFKGDGFECKKGKHRFTFVFDSIKIK